MDTLFFTHLWFSQNNMLTKENMCKKIAPPPNNKLINIFSLYTFNLTVNLFYGKIFYFVHRIFNSLRIPQIRIYNSNNGRPIYLPFNVKIRQIGLRHLFDYKHKKNLQFKKIARRSFYEEAVSFYFRVINAYCINFFIMSIPKTAYKGRFGV